MEGVHRLTLGLLSFSGCMIIIYFAHLTPAATKASFTPLTCTSPPLECWDGQNKEVFGKCTKTFKDTVVRGVLVPADTLNCYKSIYVNMDSAALGIIGILLLWVQVMNVGFSNLFNAVYGKSLNILALGGFIAQIPSVWYAVGTLMHYLNDRFFLFWYSQMYFSVTEAFTFIVTSFALDRSFNNPQLITIAAGISLSHIIQLCFDEVSNMDRIGRNALLLSGDALALTVFLQRTGSIRSRWRNIITATITMLLLFHMIFADAASTSFEV